MSMQSTSLGRLARRAATAAALASLVVSFSTATALAEDAPAAGQPQGAAGAAQQQADPASAAKQEADTVWQNRCTLCHGAMGKGDGAAAAALTPKPRDFSSPVWQASVTDEHIEKIIAEGGQAVNLSMLMPANPDLVSKPDVIKALRAHVRSLAAH
jgi:cytochrome c5